MVGKLILWDILCAEIGKESNIYKYLHDHLFWEEFLYPDKV